MQLYYYCAPNQICVSVSDDGLSGWREPRLPASSSIVSSAYRMPNTVLVSVVGFRESTEV